jgi:hypothetical protein
MIASCGNFSWLYPYDERLVAKSTVFYFLGSAAWAAEWEFKAQKAAAAGRKGILGHVIE